MSDNIIQEHFCIGCIKSVKVKHIEQISEGIKHIRFGRVKTPSGSLYHHHAIVTKVNKTTEDVTYFEFGADEFHIQLDSGAITRKKTMNFHQMKHVSVIVYHTPFYSEEDILYRIEEILNTDWSKYNILSNNCEHLAAYTMTGDKHCWQKHDKANHLLSYCGLPETAQQIIAWLKNQKNFPKAKEWLKTFVQYFAKAKAELKDFFAKLGNLENFSVAQDLLKSFLEFLGKIVAKCGTGKLYGLLRSALQNLSQIAKFLIANLKYFIGIPVLLYLCYDIGKQILDLKQLRKKGLLCKACLIKRILKLTFRALLGFASLVLLYVPGPWGIIFNIGLLGFDFVVAPGCEYLGEKFFPSFDVPKWSLTSLNDLKPGDAITMKYWGLPHEVIVTDVLPRTIVQKVVTFRADQNSNLAWLCEDDITHNLCSNKWEEAKIYKYDYPHSATRPAHEIVDEIQDRLMHQNNGTYRYQTIELINEIKLSDGQDYCTVPPKVLTPQRDLFPGDVVDSYVSGRKRQGIVVNWQYNPQEAQSGCIECIHYALPDFWATRTVMEDIVTINLDHDKIQHHDYSGHVTYSPEETVTRAKSHLGEQSFNTIRNRSSHLVKRCKVKDKEQIRKERRRQCGITIDVSESPPEQVLEDLWSTDERVMNRWSEEFQSLKRNARFCMA